MRSPRCDGFLPTIVAAAVRRGQGCELAQARDGNRGSINMEVSRGAKTCKLRLQDALQNRPEPPGHAGVRPPCDDTQLVGLEG